jgi:hypothetical protein
MTHPDPEQRGRTSTENAQERWEREGNPPSQQVSRPLELFGWTFYVVVGVLILVVLFGLLLFHGA